MKKVCKKIVLMPAIPLVYFYPHLALPATPALRMSAARVAMSVPYTSNSLVKLAALWMSVPLCHIFQLLSAFDSIVPSPSVQTSLWMSPHRPDTLPVTQLTKHRRKCVENDVTTCSLESWPIIDQVCVCNDKICAKFVTDFCD